MKLTKAFVFLFHTFERLKKTVSIFLLTVIMLQTFVNVSIGVYYYFNKAYITQQLCENRNKPKLHCNGHCYLSKQLKKAEEKENKSSQFLKEKEEIISNDVRTLPENYFPDFTITKIIHKNSSLPVSTYSNSLLKPPAA